MKEGASPEVLKARESRGKPRVGRVRGSGPCRGVIERPGGSRHDTVQSTDKSCISCYLAIHHFCYYTTKRLPTCLFPVQWYCYLSCILLGILIYWDILVLKVYLVSKQVSR